MISETTSIRIRAIGTCLAAFHTGVATYYMGYQGLVNQVCALGSLA